MKLLTNNHRCCCFSWVSILIIVQYVFYWSAFAAQTASGIANPQDHNMPSYLDKCLTKSAGRKPCVFPFIIDENSTSLNFACSREYKKDGRLEPWCPTSVDEKDALTGIDWAECWQESSCPLMSYHSNQEIRRGLINLAFKYPHLAHSGTLGNSVNGQPLAFIRIGAKDRPLLNPPVKYLANMHGNEPVGRELIYHLAHHLVYNYGIDPRITRLIDTTEIWIVPTINPDGFDRGYEGECEGGSYLEGRYNEGYKDLNRDFPTWNDFKKATNLNLQSRSPELMSYISQGRQQETRHLIHFINSQPFVLSANFHDGAVLVNYPWDNYQDLPIELHNGSHKCPDHDVFYHVSSVYSSLHQTMQKPETCTKWGPFDKGITNGADWYPVKGGMQDFNYIFTNAFEVTIEISCCKYPKEKRLVAEWENNAESLIAYIEQTHLGIKGIVSEIDENGKNVGIVVGATIRIRTVGDKKGWRAKDVLTSDRGEYWRLLLPGYAYEIQALYGELQSDIIQIKQTQNVENMPVRVDIGIRRNAFSVS